jgi:hypothetical protein
MLEQLFQPMNMILQVPIRNCVLNTVHNTLPTNFWFGQIWFLPWKNKHKKEMLKQFGSAHGKKINVLGIRDHYEFGNAQLKEILKEKLRAY